VGQEVASVHEKAGFLALEGSPGFFYDPVRDCECTVYVDDFVLVAQPSSEAGIWKQLEKLIDFKDPPEPYHHMSYSGDGKTTTMYREGHRYSLSYSPSQTP